MKKRSLDTHWNLMGLVWGLIVISVGLTACWLTDGVMSGSDNWTHTTVKFCIGVGIPLTILKLFVRWSIRDMNRTEPTKGNDETANMA